jgi:flagellar basal body rod protein FlgG
MRSKLLVATIVCCVLLLFSGAKILSFWGAPLEAESSVLRSVNRLVESESKFDVFATGNTYFSLLRNSEEVYVRAGMLCVLGHGELALRTKDGEFAFAPQITIPNDARSFEMNAEGSVFVKQDGIDSLVNVGQIDCNRFAAGRLLGKSLSSIVVSDVAPTKEPFGGKLNEMVLVGWAADSSR